MTAAGFEIKSCNSGELAMVENIKFYRIGRVEFPGCIDL